ncbi:Hypothetical predicted protein [Marmota monax]|uniref:Uncharacterized protein n=1 Tax=Marmota monax TaxID=9995 RepID=A0A5E4A6S0_MARMO|nr:hypothetical protein GHT09_002647 [Marmota monax]VTJ52967.1 Hypothetical predicted protein [Marmota monax]
MFHVGNQRNQRLAAGSDSTCLLTAAHEAPADLKPYRPTCDQQMLSRVSSGKEVEEEDPGGVGSEWCPVVQSPILTDEAEDRGWSQAVEKG